MKMEKILGIMLWTLLISATWVDAADTRWFGNGEDWSDTDWWVGGVEPTVAHSSQIDGTVVVSLPGEVVGKGFYVGYSSSHDATVQIESGDLTTSDSVQISFFGYGGKGTLRMLGGEFHPRALCILGNGSSGEGQWLVDNGTIDARSLRIGDRGQGTVSQTGGIVQCKGITMGDNDGSSGTYDIYGGTLSSSWLRLGPHRFRTVAATFRILGARADISLTADFSWYSPNTVFSAVPGSKIKMVGRYANFINELNAVNAENVVGLKNVTMEFSDNSTTTYATYEVSSADAGADVTGYCDGNFTLNTLVVGGDTPAKVRLVDSFDNGNRGGASECLYVRKLIVNAGSTLSLNGLNLYYQEADIAGTVIGTPQHVWMLDINDDGMVGEVELLTMAANWLDDTCTCPDLCDGADFDTNGIVDLSDFAILVDNWLTGGSL